MATRRSSPTSSVIVSLLASVEPTDFTSRLVTGDGDQLQFTTIQGETSFENHTLPKIEYSY